MLSALLQTAFVLSVAATLLGVSLAWAGAMCPQGSRIRQATSWAGWLLGGLGLFSLGLTMGQVLLVGAIPFLVVAIVLGFLQYRKSEQRILFWTLTSAAERNIPLWKAAHAFAMERVDPQRILAAPPLASLGGKAQFLGNRLKQGAPLLQSLRDAGIRPDLDTLIALLIGEHFGAMQRAVRTALDDSRRLSDRWTWLATRAGYLAIVGIVLGATTLMVRVRVQPQLALITQEFGVPAPQLGGVSLDQWMNVFGPLLLFGLLLLVPLSLIIWMIAFFQLVDADWPLITSLVAPLDRARLLRGLSWALQEEPPGENAPPSRPASVERALQVLADGYPKRWVRARAQAARGEILAGAAWCEALTRYRLVSNAEAGVLHAAERVGNVAWALRELSNRRVDRFADRLQTLYSLLFPLAMLLAAVFVLLGVLQLFLPLTQMIRELS